MNTGATMQMLIHIKRCFVHKLSMVQTSSCMLLVMYSCLQACRDEINMLMNVIYNNDSKSADSFSYRKSQDRFSSGKCLCSLIFYYVIVHFISAY